MIQYYYLCAVNTILYFTVPDGCVVDSDPVYGIQWPSTPVNTTAIQACGGANVVGETAIVHNGLY